MITGDRQMVAQGYETWDVSDSDVKRVTRCLEDNGWDSWGLSWYQHPDKGEYRVNATLNVVGGRLIYGTIEVAGAGDTRRDAVSAVCEAITAAAHGRHNVRWR